MKSNKETSRIFSWDVWDMHTAVMLTALITLFGIGSVFLTWFACLVFGSHIWQLAGRKALRVNTLTLIRSFVIAILISGVPIMIVSPFTYTHGVIAGYVSTAGVNLLLFFTGTLIMLTDKLVKILIRRHHNTFC